MAEQPAVAQTIAEALGCRRSTMLDAMRLRQGIIRRGIVTDADAIAGLTAWVTVLFDLANLRLDRRRAMELHVTLANEALSRLRLALERSANGCILAVPHVGSLELLVTHLTDLGFDVGFVFKVSDTPTPTERWINEGRAASLATPIRFGQRSTGAQIATLLRRGGIVLMVVDVYPSARFPGIGVRVHDVTFNVPPGPARYARTGTLVLPGVASRRDAHGFAIDILDPIDDHPGDVDADEVAFTQHLATRVAALLEREASGFWLWHPILNDPFLAAAQRERPELLPARWADAQDDEAAACAVDALAATLAGQLATP